jgi:hypothetical protein
VGAQRQSGGKGQRGGQPGEDIHRICLLESL